MLSIVALWGIPALIQTHGQIFVVGIGRHVVGRSFATMEGHGADSLGMYLMLLPFYFVTIFLSFFPWSIKLPWLIRKLLGEKKARITDPDYNANKIDNYLVIGIAIIFVIFTLVKTKLPHYTLPAFPLLSLLLLQAGRGKRGTFLQELRSCIGFGLSCNCSCRSSVRLPAFSCLSAFPGIARLLASKHGIWRSRF